MLTKLHCSLLCLSACALIISAFAEINVKEQNDEPKLLEVKVHYETLCPDSVNFIRGQLFPAMIGKELLQYTDLRFIPYGKVTSWTDPTTNQTTLYCQHGREECELNAMHACIIEHNSVRDQLKIFNCAMGRYRMNVQKCADELKININAAKACKQSRSVEDILQKYGLETDAIDISFVPSIEMDGNFERRQQRDILYNFELAFFRQYKQLYDIELPGCNV